MVLAHVTPYGMSGERAEEPGNELTVAALSGWASINGDSTSYPLRPSGRQVAFCAGAMAFAAVVGALSHRDRHPG
ncbi:MAG TPA: CoA transferase, partial [Tepidiformaceae bacterium]|nr:CoA transferase [Tepidiformaceae bacterium]